MEGKGEGKSPYQDHRKPPGASDTAEGKREGGKRTWREKDGAVSGGRRRMEREG